MKLRRGALPNTFALHTQRLEKIERLTEELAQEYDEVILDILDRDGTSKIWLAEHLNVAPSYVTYLHKRALKRQAQRAEGGSSAA